MTYDAILLVSFGGPEGPDDVIPFLENVLRGLPIPRGRLLEVAEHYLDHGGVSPINAQNRELIAHLEVGLRERDISLPVYWGNRNWNPTIPLALDQMKSDGVETFLALFTSSYSSYSGCRQYRENINAALGDLQAPLAYDKIRVWYNHPLWIELLAERYREALAQVPEERRKRTTVAFTAHSIPMTMADRCNYHRQLLETCRLAAAAAGIEHWELVFQSRSGRPEQPWLEPDICDHMDTLQGDGWTDVIIHPIGFVSDHMEVIFDLDTEACEHGEKIGLRVTRAGTAGVHPLFIEMLVELVAERLNPSHERRAIGAYGPSHETCPPNCCMPGPRRRHA
jgi:protoporphyrin/coproporphyrin ferrochelatase